MSRLHLLGLNHKTAPVEVRERFALSASKLERALDYVRGARSVSETVIVSTCNRVEIYLWGDENCALELRRNMAALHPFGDSHTGDGRGLESHFYIKQDEEAARHLMRVASGLDSLVVGESEILGQVKVALETARKSGAAGRNLDELFRRAISCGKRARSETGISRGALSVGAAAVELAKQIFGNLNGHTVLILGAGKMSARVAQCLVSSGARSVLVANRTLERAQELAKTFSSEGAGAQAVTWDEFPAQLANADIVIASTRAPHYVVTPQHLYALKNRRRALLLIDIAVPRDIDPNCNRFDDVFCFDIDDLQNVVEDGRQSRQSEVVQVEAIIESEVMNWQAWTRTSGAQPIMAGLAIHASTIREAEVAATLARLEHLSEKDREVIAAMGRAIAQKIVHAPLSHMRNGGESDAEALARAFNLQNGQQKSGGETD